jgi:hypothetical protein
MTEDFHIRERWRKMYIPNRLAKHDPGLCV